MRSACSKRPGRIRTQFTIRQTASEFVELLHRLGLLGQLTSDSAGDAELIASCAGQRARRMHAATPEAKALCTVVRTTEDVADRRITAASRLSALLDAHWPGPTAISDVESALAWFTSITKPKGSSPVRFRCACNKTLRKPITCFADNSRHTSPWAAEVYASAIVRGHDPPRVVRVLALTSICVL